MADVSDAEILAVLKRRFGYDSLRGIQKRAVRYLVSNQDVLVTAPTGFGKSMCFQLPALVKFEEGKREGRGAVAIIVCPLIALLQNQVAGLRKHGIPCELISSSETQTANRKVIAKLLSPHPPSFSMLYITAERLTQPAFLDTLEAMHKRGRLSLVAIDEAHCISQWGHDFRPAYSQLGVVKERFPDVPVAAFTATATQSVQEHILQSLKIEGAHKVHKSFLRSNIRYECRYADNLDVPLAEDVFNYVQSQYCPDSNRWAMGIIYAFKTETVDNMAELLKRQGVPAVGYHGKMTQKARKEAQQSFESGRVPIAVASVAFGMGLDISAIRFVVHVNLPKSMEAFYQESGRAGRDGLRSDSILYYSEQDISLLRFLVANDPKLTGKREEAAMRAADKIQQYCTAIKCRRVSVLAHFDEKTTAENVCRESWGKGCDVCDNRADVRRRMYGRSITVARRPQMRRVNTKFSPAAEFHSARTLLKTQAQAARKAGRDEVEEIDSDDDWESSKLAYEIQRKEGVVEKNAPFSSARNLLQQRQQGQHMGFQKASEALQERRSTGSTSKNPKQSSVFAGSGLEELLEAELDDQQHKSRLRKPRGKINDFIERGKRGSDGGNSGAPSLKKQRRNHFS